MRKALEGIFVNNAMIEKVRTVMIKELSYAGFRKLQEGVMLLALFVPLLAVVPAVVYFYNGVDGIPEWLSSTSLGIYMIMNLFTCIWKSVRIVFGIPDAVRKIVTTIATGGVAMVIVFAIDKTIFSPGFGEKK